VTSGGTIPDNADYTVILEPQGHTIGTVNEDFAIESMSGDVFQLGNASYRILRVEAGRVRVEDAHGMSPTIPFWLGEAPGRSDALSSGVARLRATLETLLDADGMPPRLDAARAWLMETIGLDPSAATQIVDYLASARAALSALPTADTLVMERFFDEAGGMQLVLHAPYGSRINRAWGLALRKRFCRSFNFELQAAATEDAIVLSLSTSHSFPLDEVWRYLRSNTGEHVLIQALLDAPLFNVRWRWNATTSLALPRYAGGRKVAPQLQRMKSDDLLAAVFPEQAACLENIVGERELPSHPLVDQTVDDCLHEAMDCEGWLALLKRIEQGQVRLIARDLPAPSPLAMEILNARPYAFLDDAPLEERRTQAVMNRRWSDPAAAGDLGALDAGAIAAVADEAWPRARDTDEMQEALMGVGCITEAEAERNIGWPALLGALAQGGRATRLDTGSGVRLWVPLERVSCFRAAYAQAICEPPLAIPESLLGIWEAIPGENAQGASDNASPINDAYTEIVRARLSGFGPQSVAEIAAPLGLPPGTVATALARLEGEGYAMRGRYTPGTEIEEWCERHLLARIHRYTIKRLRREIEPVEARDFMRFLFDWQHLSSATRWRGQDALPALLDQLEGYEAAAGAWESELLPARLGDYFEPWLDELCRAGKIVWSRLGSGAKTVGKASAGPVRATPIVLLPRRQHNIWRALLQRTGAGAGKTAAALSSRAEHVFATLLRDGAMFFDELAADTRLLPAELETALGELVANGLAHADSYAGLRALLMPAAKRASQSRRRRRGPTLEEAGRWAPIRSSTADTRAAVASQQQNSSARKSSNLSHASSTSRATGLSTRLDSSTLEHVVHVLLRRYGVICWRMLEREAAWLPAWRELLPELHRLEARGEIRGGRFVAGLAGEQFALPEAIPLLRDVRRRERKGELVCVCGSDPLNLCGTLLAGEKVPALAGHRIVFEDGVPVAAMMAGKMVCWQETDGVKRERWREALVERH
jgi:ATP-dependent Lhr-like helicase